jgi:hypothetical protein
MAMVLSVSKWAFMLAAATSLLGTACSRSSGRAETGSDARTTRALTTDAGVSFDPVVVWGPVEVARTKGAPVQTTFDFELPADLVGPFTLVLENHGVSSAVVALNGTEIFAPSAFNTNARYLDAEVSPRSTNRLSVELRGKPGGSVGLSLTARGWEKQVTVAPTGGTVEAGGVVLDVPTGALAGQQQLTMTVRRYADRLTIDVQPEVHFLVPVRVVVGPNQWPVAERALVLREATDGMWDGTSLRPDGDVSVYLTDHFSANHIVRATGTVFGPLNFRLGQGIRYRASQLPTAEYTNSDICTLASGTFLDQCGLPPAQATEDSQKLCNDIRDHLVDARMYVDGFDDASARASFCGGARTEAEAYLLQPDLRAALADVKAAFDGSPLSGTLKLWLNGAYDSSGIRTRQGGLPSPTDMHASGRAIDLGLCAAVSAGSCNEKDRSEASLSQLAILVWDQFLVDATQPYDPPRDVTVTVLHERNSNGNHVHATQAYKCPDPWSVWDATDERCRRPSYRIESRGAAAAAGVITTMPSAGSGAMVCSDPDPATGYRVCTEDPDGGDGTVVLTANTVGGSGAVFAGWSGSRCVNAQTTVGAPSITFPDRRSDIECTALFDCPSGASWNATNKRCEVGGGSPPGPGPCTDPTKPSWNGQQCVACPPGTGWNASTNSCAPCGTGTILCRSQCVSNACSGEEIFDSWTCSCGCPVNCCGRCFPPYSSADPYYCCARSWCRNTYYGC